MARLVKASNGTGAASNTVPVVPSCWDYSYPGQSPAVKQQIVEMAMNASGIRDTARVLHISTHTVMTELTGCEFCNCL